MLDRETAPHIRYGQTHDHEEGVNTFMEKRQPQLLGR